MTTGYRPHVMRMVKDIVQDPDLQKRYQSDARDAVWDAYGLDEEERAAFARPGWPALAAIGMPPVSIIGFLIYTNEGVHEQKFSMKEFADRLLADRRPATDDH